MVIKRALIVSACIIFSLQQNSYAVIKNIIFDMGGVLVEKNSRAAFKHSGYRNVWRYLLAHPSALLSLKTTIRTRLFTFLSHAVPRNPDEAPARDDEGNLIPQIMCDWMKNIRSNKETLAVLNQVSKQHPEYFSSTAEQKLLLGIASTIFTPKKFIATQQFIDFMRQFVESCHAQGYSLYILSNWDTETFSLLQQEYPDFFNLFSGIVLSGECHVLKPDPAIYQHLLSKYCLRSDESIFIDDRIENVKAALDLGFHAFQFIQGYPSRYSISQQSNLPAIQTALRKLSTMPASPASAVA